MLKIDKGKASDLKGQRLPASATGMVPYYIRAELSYAGADFQGPAPAIGGQFSDGSTLFNLKLEGQAQGPTSRDVMTEDALGDRRAAPP